MHRLRRSRMLPSRFWRGSAEAVSVRGGTFHLNIVTYTIIGIFSRQKYLSGKECLKAVYDIGPSSHLAIRFFFLRNRISKTRLWYSFAFHISWKKLLLFCFKHGNVLFNWHPRLMLGSFPWIRSHYMPNGDAKRSSLCYERCKQREGRNQDFP